MSEASFGAAPDFRIGSVLGRAWSTFVSNVFSLVIATLLVGAAALPLAILEQTPDEDMTFTQAWSSLAALALYFVVSLFVWGTIFGGTVDHLATGRVAIRDAASRSIMRVLPFALLSIVFSIVGSAAFLLLVIPGVIFACVYPLAPVVCIVEGCGVFRSFSRSAELTRGRRWHILGLHAVNLVFLSAVGIVLSLLVTALAAFGGPIISLIVTFLAFTLMAWFPLITGAVLYYDLARPPAAPAAGVHRPVL